MPKGNHQASLHAFFGGGGGAKKKQTDDDPPVDVENEENSTAAASASSASSNDSSNIGATAASSMDVELNKKRSKVPPQKDDKNNNITNNQKKKRRVIEDDDSSSSSDDDDEDNDDNDDNGDKKIHASDDSPPLPLPEESKESATTSSKRPAASSSVEAEVSKKDTDKNKKKASPTVSSSAADPPAKKAPESKATTKATTTSPSMKVVSRSDLVKSLNKSSAGDKKGSSPIKTNEQLVKDLEAQWQDMSNSSDGAAEDQELPYSILCEALSKIESVSSRLQIQEILTNLLRQVLLVSPNDLCHVLYLSANAVAPAYDCVELGIGDAILIKAIAEATGTSPAIIKQKYESEGDLGLVAQNCKGKQKTLGGFFVSKASSDTKKKKASLSVKQVLQVFREIAKMKGNQSQKLKVDKIKGLLVKADKVETRYIIRGLQGKLRIGLAESTVIISLAHALAMTVPSTVVEKAQATKSAANDDDDIPEEAKQYMNKSTPPEKRLEAAVAVLKKAYSEVPSYDALWDAASKVGLEDLHKLCTLTPGIPVAPMLAKPTKSIQEVLQRLNGLRFTCEYKYDGERAQVHLLPGGKTKVFSRNLLDTSEKYPEVPLFVKEACKGVESFVLDAEVVAFNNKTGQLVPFQILSTRKKTEESAETAKVQIIVQAFDLMYLNGKSLLGKTLAERRQLMHEHFSAVPGKFQFAKSIDHKENGDTGVIEEFLDAAVKGQCEGLMVKTLDVNAIYEPSRRSLNWLKLKKDYLDGLGDSVDLVPLGAYHGRGKRTGVYGAYLLACYDTDTEEFQSVCKIGTGFSDEDLKTLAESLNKHRIPQKSPQYNVSDQLECDVWFDAVQVWEVKAADLSKSSAHRGAVGKTGEQGRGIGLRFPRFERLRDDKRPDEATDSDQILDMYYAQDTIVGGPSGDGGGDDGI